jgi:hypothetical protein
VVKTVFTVMVFIFTTVNVVVMLPVVVNNVVTLVFV